MTRGQQNRLFTFWVFSVQNLPSQCKDVNPGSLEKLYFIASCMFGKIFKAQCPVSGAKSLFSFTQNRRNSPTVY